MRPLVAALLGAAACYGALALTEPPGPGLDPDSMSYLGAAESLARRGTLRIPASSWADPDSTSPLGHFPPGFPVLIAGPVALGADPVQTARGVIALSAFVTVGLAVWLVAEVAGLAAGALAGVTLLVSPSYAFDHWQVISESLCLALLVATLGLMARSRRPWTYGATAAAAAAVRYAALSAVGAAVLWAFGTSGRLGERLRRAAWAALPAVVVQGLWAVRTAVESGGDAHTLGWQGGLGASVAELGGTLAAWLAPAVTAPVVAWPLAVAVAAAGCWLLARAARSGAGDPQHAALPRFLAATGMLAACYAAVVVASRLLVFDNIPFDQRLLSPFIALVEIAVAAALGAAWWRWRPGKRIAVAALAALWLAASARATAAAVADALDGGWGYSSDEWRASRLGEWLRERGRAHALFSNNPAAVWFLAHRPSREAPADLAPDSVRAFGRLLAERGGVLVRFPYDYEPVASPDSLAARLGLPVLAAFGEGKVWGPPGPVP